MTPTHESLNERELRVLEAIVQSYVETAEPVGSRTIARRFGLGVSPATIRNAMSDLEEKGYLFHPHTSAGRVPTDRAYRVYVDSLMRSPSLSAAQEERLREDLIAEGSADLGHHLPRGAGAERAHAGAGRGGGAGVGLGGAGAAGAADGGERPAAARPHPEERRGAQRVRARCRARCTPRRWSSIAVVLNDRLAGLTLREIRQTLPERVRDTAKTSAESELLDIFVATGDQLFDVAGAASEPVVLGRTLGAGRAAGVRQRRRRCAS